MPLATEDLGARGKVGTLDERHQVVGGGLRVREQVQRGVDDLAEVVRRDLGRHAHGDALGSVDEQVREARRQHGGLLGGVVVVRLEVDGLLVDRVEQLERERREAALGVAHRGGALVGTGAAEVPVAADERVAHREVLDHAHQRVIDRAVAVGVIRAHDLTDDLGALGVRSVGSQTLVEHRVQDAPVNGLQAVTRVGQRARHDDRHGVLEERALHLEVDLDGLDVADDAVVARRVGVRCRNSCVPCFPLP